MDEGGAGRHGLPGVEDRREDFIVHLYQGKGLFGGCPADTKVQLDTSRIHYDEITLKGTFHHTPATVRTALGLIADGRMPARSLIQQRAALIDLPDVLRSLMNGNCAVKVAIDPQRSGA